MTKKVHIIEAFDTSAGRVITVPNDQLYKTGEAINTDEGVFLIKAIMHPKDPDAIAIALRVENA